MSFDQVFKDLLHACFKEFFELFYPDVAKKLDFSTLSFSEQELFTDIPEGKKRIIDVVANVRTLEGEPEILLVHIEVEYEPDNNFPERMYRYHKLLTLRHNLPVLPFAIYLARGAKGRTTAQFIDQVLDRQVNVFTYDLVALPDLDADDYLDLPNPLAPALSALMRTSKLGAVAQKFKSLLNLARSGANEAQMVLLTNIVEKYLTLTATQQTEFEVMISKPEGEEVKMVVSVYEERGEQRGIEIGEKKGVLRGERKSLILLLEHKFGTLSEDIDEQIQKIEDIEELDRLFRLVLVAQTLDEVKFTSHM